MKTTAGIYARISEDRDETQAGVNRQLEDCRELCERNGWTRATEYIDNDVSAYKGGKRPEYQQMLADLADGRINALVVYHQDRLWRRPRELEDFIEICNRANVTKLASVCGEIDLATDDGLMKLRILGAVARNQSDATARRVRRKALEIAQAGGIVGGGHRPFGFEDDAVTLRPEEAEIIRDLAERAIGGESLQSLCRSLNERGVRTGAGGQWLPWPLKRLLRSARISGQREHKGEIIAKAKWQAIVSPQQTQDLRALFDDPKRKATRAPRRYPLRGLLRCAKCGEILRARPRDDGRRQYVCAKDVGAPGCGGSSTLAEPVEEYATEFVLHALDTPALAKAIRGQRLKGPDGEWQRVADRATTRLDELAETYGKGAISLREWLAARDPLQGKLDEANRRMARDKHLALLSEHVGKGAELRKRWPALGVDRQNAILSAALLHIEVGPALRGRKRFDPDRFKPIWRH